MSHVLRTLVLCNALVLALPTGWCCTFAAPPVEAAPVQKAPACPHCAANQEKPANPDPKPKPSHPTPSCQCQPDLLVSTGADKVEVDLTPVFLLTVPVAELVAHPEANDASPAFHTNSPPRHVRHCLWLC